MAGRRRGFLLLIMLGCLAAACTLTSIAAAAAGPAGPAGIAAPAAEPASVEPGGTEPASIVPPTTAAPTEPPPTTVQPTEPPPTTAEPTTAPPTVPDTTPAEPTEPAPTTVAPTMTVSPATGGSSSVLPWVLAGLGVLVLIGLIVWFAQSSTRRSDTIAAWRSRRLNAYAEGAALHDAVMSTEGRPMQANEAAARWTDIQYRADNFNQRLYQLRETAPDEAGRAHIDELLVSLQALRSALDAQRAAGAGWTAGAASSMTAGVVRDRLNDFRILLGGLRDADPGTR